MLLNIHSFINVFHPDLPSFFINNKQVIAITNITSDIIEYINLEESKFKLNKNASMKVLMKIHPNVIHTQTTFFVEIISNKHAA